jgi:hypothetical protein
MCNVASCWIYKCTGILLGVHYILHISRIRVKHWPWGLPSPLFIGYRYSFSVVKQLGHDTNLHPVSRLKNKWSQVSTLPICLQSVDMGNFTLLFCLLNYPILAKCNMKGPSCLLLIFSMCILITGTVIQTVISVK